MKVGSKRLGTLITALLAAQACQPTSPLQAPASPSPGTQAASRPLHPDADGDGILDHFETALGTDPNQAEADTDGDQLPDALEKRLGLNPEKDDSDGDGFSDQFELLHDMRALHAKGEVVRRAYALQALDPTHALSSDVNGDGTHDGQEDWDGDGVPNGIERTGYWVDADGSFKPMPASPDPGVLYFKTDPTAKSTDLDPYSDGDEARLATTALDPVPSHPLIAACPDLTVSLTGYGVDLNAQVTQSFSKTANKSWRQTSTDTTTDSYERDTDFKDTATVGWSEVLGGSASNTASYGVATKSNHSHTLTVVTDTSGYLTQQWSTLSQTNDAQAATLTPTLTIVNQGTMPIAGATLQVNVLTDADTSGAPLLTLQLDPLTLDKGQSSVQTLPKAGQSAYYLPMSKLRLLQRGLPVSVAFANEPQGARVPMPAGAVAQTQGCAALNGDHTDATDYTCYMSRLRDASMSVWLDRGTGDMKRHYVRAARLVGSDLPALTLDDALTAALGLSGAPKPTTDGTSGWAFKMSRDAAVRTRPLGSGESVVAKIAPTGALAQPRIGGVWFGEDPAGTRRVYVSARDHLGLSQMSFKPASDAAAIPLAPDAVYRGGVYSAPLPDAYTRRSGTEVVTATNVLGNTVTKTPPIKSQAFGDSMTFDMGDWTNVEVSPAATLNRNPTWKPYAIDLDGSLGLIQPESQAAPAPDLWFWFPELVMHWDGRSNWEAPGAHIVTLEQPLNDNGSVLFSLQDYQGAGYAELRTRTFDGPTQDAANDKWWYYNGRNFIVGATPLTYPWTTRPVIYDAKGYGIRTAKGNSAKLRVTQAYALDPNRGGAGGLTYEGVAFEGALY